jgi:transposase
VVENVVSHYLRIWRGSIADFCSQEQTRCAHCGEPTEFIGYLRSEQLDVEPAEYFVLMTKREKRGCPCCQRGVVTAPVPTPNVKKSVGGDRVVIDAVSAKYCDPLPLYRQRAVLGRETGIEMGRATLDGWVMTVGKLLIPLIGAMRAELLGGGYIQADETPADVQMRGALGTRRGGNPQAYLWQYGRRGGGVVFEFQMGRRRAGPEWFLEGFDGSSHTDGCVAHEKVRAEDGPCRVLGPHAPRPVRGPRIGFRRDGGQGDCRTY